MRNECREALLWLNLKSCCLMRGWHHTLQTVGGLDEVLARSFDVKRNDGTSNTLVICEDVCLKLWWLDLVGLQAN